MTNAVAPLPFRSDGRRQSRTHLFVAASLICGRSTIPVRVRNMSASGALIEFAGAGPSMSANVLLRRGALEVPGSVAWIDGHRAGLAFDTTVEVGQWMARIGSVGQSRIDEIVAEIRSNPMNCTGTSVPRTSLDLASQLRDVREQLSRLADSLLNDDEVIARHPEIQIFDVALQKLDRLIRDQSN